MVAGGTTGSHTQSTTLNYQGSVKILKMKEIPILGGGGGGAPLCVEK